MVALLSLFQGRVSSFSRRVWPKDGAGYSVPTTVLEKERSVHRLLAVDRLTLHALAVRAEQEQVRPDDAVGFRQRAAVLGRIGLQAHVGFHLPRIDAVH